MQWWEKWDARTRWFDENGTRHRGTTARTLGQRFNRSVKEARHQMKMQEVRHDEEVALFTMLKGMLAFRPEERQPAKELVESEWMQKWALPELGRGREIQ